MGIQNFGGTNQPGDAVGQTTPSFQSPKPPTTGGPPEIAQPIMPTVQPEPLAPPKPVQTTVDNSQAQRLQMVAQQQQQQKFQQQQETFKLKQQKFLELQQKLQDQQKKQQQEWQKQQQEWQKKQLPQGKVIPKAQELPQGKVIPKVQQTLPQGKVMPKAPTKQEQQLNLKQQHWQNFLDRMKQKKIKQKQAIPGLKVKNPVIQSKKDTILGLKNKTPQTKKTIPKLIPGKIPGGKIPKVIPGKKIPGKKTPKTTVLPRGRSQSVPQKQLTPTELKQQQWQAHLNDLAQKRAARRMNRYKCGGTFTRGSAVRRAKRAALAKKANKEIKKQMGR